MNKRILIYLSILFCTISCSEKKEAEVGKSIKNLIERFPELKTVKKNFGNNYKLAKSVKNGEFDFEIQLFSEPDSIQGKQKIIVFINSKKECFAIPFFSNKYKDYWRFPFDKEIPNVPKVNSTFTKELNSALNRLSENGNPKKELIKHKMIEELLLSVLNCRKLVESDSLLIYKTIHWNLDIPVEESDSAFVRLRKNYALMKKDWHPQKYQYNYNCYLDNNDARIYQFDYNKNGKLILVKTYRQDQGFTYTYL